MSRLTTILSASTFCLAVSSSGTCSECNWFNGTHNPLIQDPCTQAYDTGIQDIPSITQLSRTLHNEQINHLEPVKGRCYR
ncbi:hypothetical protein VPHD292_0096 [Vibrio phage D292]